MVNTGSINLIRVVCVCMRESLHTEVVFPRPRSKPWGDPVLINTKLMMTCCDGCGFHPVPNATLFNLLATALFLYQLSQLEGHLVQYESI